LRRQPDLDIVRAQNVGLRTADDPEILAWAAADRRILITHDRNTMPDFAYQRVRAGLLMPGVFVIRNQPPLGDMIEEILLVALASTPDEWTNRVEFLPS
jgi:predicted nuclease of predicted toxin-antitoxin system